MQGKIICPDGCGMDIKNELKVLIADVEKELGFELESNSGARCDKYNATIVGSIAGDAHTLGLAIDAKVDPDSADGREKIARLIEALQKRGIRRYGDGMGKHKYLHFDRADTLPTPRWWFYL